MEEALRKVEAARSKLLSCHDDSKRDVLAKKLTKYEKKVEAAKRRKQKLDDGSSSSQPSAKRVKKEKKEKKERKEALAADGARALHVAAKTARADPAANPANSLTLCLFYQYIEPLLSVSEHKDLLAFIQARGDHHELGGRMRCAREGLNCTLTGSYEGVRAWTADLRSYHPAFMNTEFKLTDNLPPGQMFPKLHAFSVSEIVNYGLGGDKAPPIDKTAVHLEPHAYHKKMAEPNTVRSGFCPLALPLSRALNLCRGGCLLCHVALGDHRRAEPLRGDHWPLRSARGGRRDA